MNCQIQAAHYYPTRDSNILDQCYTAIKDAYHSVPRATFGLSDHCLVHLIPTYRQKLELNWTDCSVFEAAATDLYELTETVTSYISFCEDICIHTRTFLSFNNNKPWFTGKLKQLCHAKEDAYRSGDKILYIQARNRLIKEIRVGKRNYSEKLRKELSANKPASVWTGLSNITMYKTPPPQSGEWTTGSRSECLYCRSEKDSLSPPSTLTCISHIHLPPLQPSSILPAQFNLCLMFV